MGSGTWSPIVATAGPAGPAGPAGVNASPAAAVPAIDAKSAASTLLLASQAAKFFVPGKAYVRVKTLTGALVVAPILRIGNNGTHDNVCPAFTLTGAVVGQVFVIPIVSTILHIDIGATGISVEVLTPATATTMTIDVYMDGVVVS